MKGHYYSDKDATAVEIKCHYHHDEYATTMCSRCGCNVCDKCYMSVNGQPVCIQCLKFERGPYSGQRLNKVTIAIIIIVCALILAVLVAGYRFWTSLLQLLSQTS